MPSRGNLVQSKRRKVGHISSIVLSTLVFPRSSLDDSSLFHVSLTWKTLWPYLSICRPKQECPYNLPYESFQKIAEHLIIFEKRINHTWDFSLFNIIFPRNFGGAKCQPCVFVDVICSSIDLVTLVDLSIVRGTTSTASLVIFSEA